MWRAPLRGRHGRRIPAFLLVPTLLFVLSCDGDQPTANELDGIEGGSPLNSHLLPGDFLWLPWVYDDAGAIDAPTQSDLNAFTRADNKPQRFGVAWTWDATSVWTGSGQTGDACVLLDVDAGGSGLGFADYVLCVRISNSPDGQTVSQFGDSPILYTCGDRNHPDRCVQPVKVVPKLTSACTVGKIPEQHEGYQLGWDGVDTEDVLAWCDIDLAALGVTQATDVDLMNACSYPSGSPNSNPFDCVITPGAGFIRLQKETNPDASGATFSFTLAPAAASGTSEFTLTDDTEGVESQVIPVAPGTYALSEHSLPEGWSLTGASCTDGNSSFSDPTISGIQVATGTTVTCTFTDVVKPVVYLEKVFAPTDDEGLVSFTVGGTADDNDSNGYGHDGITAPHAFDVGQDVAFSESGFGGTDLAAYTSSWSCADAGDLEIASGSGPSGSTGALSAGDVIVCTFTNTRNPLVRLKKVFAPSDDGGTVSFDVGGNADTNGDAGFGHDGTTTFYAFDVGQDVAFSEAGFGGTDLADYTTSWSCVDADAVEVASGNGTSGSTGALAAGDEITCTFTNTRDPVLRLRKVFAPTDDGGAVSFDVGGNADTNGDAGFGHDQSTAFYAFSEGQSVAFSEAGHDGTDLADYTTSWSCRNADDVEVASGNGTSGSTGSLSAGDQITCTFTNTRNPVVRLRKAFAPTDDGGTVSFDVGGNADTNGGSGFGHGGVTQFYAFSVDQDVAFSEAGFDGTDLADYTSSWSCRDGDDVEIASDTGTSGSTGALSAGDRITCTFTNSRDPVVRLRKVFAPTDDGGTVSFDVGGNTDTNGDTGFGHDQASAFYAFAVGQSVAFSETGYDGTVLADYTSSWSCVDAVGQVIASDSGTSGSTPTLTAGDRITCTFTNTRNPLVRARKVFTPTNDGGAVSFDVGGNADTNDGNGFGHDGITDFYEFSVDQSVDFSETGFGGTDLADYRSSWRCLDADGQEVASGDGASGSTGTLSAGDRITCTFTNTRNPVVRLRKVFAPTDDGGTVSFDVGGTPDDNEGAGFGHDQATGDYEFAVGDDVSFEELGVSPTDLTEYTSAWECRDQGDQLVSSGTGTSGSTGTLSAGDRITCTFTNTRDPVVRLRKVFSPTNDGGTVAFDVDGASDDNGGAGYGHNEGTGFEAFSVGDDVTFEEVGVTPTDLTAYGSSWECRDESDQVVNSGTGTSGSTGTLSAGDRITCTFTNTRDPVVRLRKVFAPTDDGGTVSFELDGASDDNGGAGYGHGEATGFTTFAPGDDIGFQELGLSPTDLTAYTSSWECRDQGGQAAASGNGTSGNTGTLSAGDEITCTFTNTRDPVVRLRKVLDPTDDGGTVSFDVDGVTDDNGGDGYGHDEATAFKAFAVGDDISFEELGVSPADLAAYTSSWECRDQGDQVVASGNGTSGGTGTLSAGDEITCTFTNTRDPVVRLRKVLDPTDDGGTVGFDVDGVTDDNGGNGYGHDEATAFKTFAVGDDVSFEEVGVSPTDLAAYGSSWECRDAGDQAVASGNGTSGSTGTLSAGDRITCTFTNIRQPGLIIRKVTVPAGIAGSFGFTQDFDGSGSFSLVHGGETMFPAAPGTEYTVTEDDPGPEFRLSDISCTGTDAANWQEDLTDRTLTVTPQAGDNVVCTFENTVDVLDISVTKTASPDELGVFGPGEIDFDADVVYDGSGTGGQDVNGLVFLPWVYDDAGEPDAPAQSDLNAFTRADNVPGVFGAAWTWDATAVWTGSGQTGDACALLDTDVSGAGNGFADYVLCVRISNNPEGTEVFQLAESPILYSCGDRNHPDRCAQPVRVVPFGAGSLTECEVSKIPESGGADDYDLPWTGLDGTDVKASCVIDLDDIAAASAEDIDFFNTCSFPSGSPNSNPFDCVITPGSGFLQIHKITQNPVSQNLFGFVLSPPAVVGSNIGVAGGVETGLITMPPGTDYDITEVMGANWNLIDATCVLGGQETGTWDGTSAVITDFEIASGQTTVCTFTNDATITGDVEFTIEVTNHSPQDATLDSLVDTVFDDLLGLGICSSVDLTVPGGGGTYTCVFTRELTGQPGDVHTNTVTAGASDAHGNSDSDDDDATVTFLGGSS